MEPKKLAQKGMSYLEEAIENQQELSPKDISE